MPVTSTGSVARRCSCLLLALAVALTTGTTTSARSHSVNKSPVPKLSPQPSAAGAAVYLIAPRDGEVVGQTFTVVFGLRGMGVAPAGTTLAHTGHHHLLIDYPGIPALERTLPSSEQLRHFGGGQTQTVLNLAPGQHSLRLLFADGRHLPHKPPLLSDTIVITVR